MISLKLFFRFIFLVFTVSFSAQNYRFVYEYKMVPDTSAKDSVIIDYMSLDTDGKKSFFYNSAKYERDSVFKADRNYKSLMNARSYDRNLNYVVEKNYSSKSIKLYDKFKSVNILVNEKEIPNWKIENDFEKINEIYCQKAIVEYKGRKWEAWFSKDYAVNDGPYKFSGLPGLVIRLADSENEHVFNLIQIKKIANMYALLPKTTKEMAFKEYRKVMQTYHFNPGEDIESMNVDSKAGTIGIRLKDGYIANLSQKQLKGKNIDTVLSKFFRKSNNPIEKE